MCLLTRRPSHQVPRRCALSQGKRNSFLGGHIGWFSRGITHNFCLFHLSRLCGSAISRLILYFTCSRALSSWAAK